MSVEELTAAQDTARAAHDRFIDVAAAYFSANAWQSVHTAAEAVAVLGRVDPVRGASYVDAA